MGHRMGRFVAVIFFLLLGLQAAPICAQGMGGGFGAHAPKSSQPASGQPQFDKSMPVETAQQRIKALIQTVEWLSIDNVVIDAQSLSYSVKKTRRGGYLAMGDLGSLMTARMKDGPRTYEFASTPYFYAAPQKTGSDWCLSSRLDPKNLDWLCWAERGGCHTI